MSTGLKLRIEDDSDLAIVSAHMQDALVSVGDMQFVEGQTRFVLVANRFAGPADEAAEDELGSDVEAEAAPVYQRTLTALSFEAVLAVASRDIDMAERGRFLNLLAVTREGAFLHLAFSEGAEIRLKLAVLRGYMEDFGEPWPTSNMPKHDIDGNSAPQGA